MSKPKPIKPKFTDLQLHVHAYQKYKDHLKKVSVIGKSLPQFKLKGRVPQPTVVNPPKQLRKSIHAGVGAQHDVSSQAATQRSIPEPPTDPTTGAPIFIVGCGHSGTSLLLAMLGSHKNIHAIPGESRCFLLADPVRKNLFKKWNNLCKQKGKKRWVEKTPKHILKISLILKRVPNAKIIIMVRDGRDVACSIKARSGSFSRGLERWISENAFTLAHKNNPNCKMVKYEDIIENADKASNEILQFLGEPAQNLTGYHREKKLWYSNSVVKPKSAQGIENHMQLRNWQVNQPIFDGRNRWRTDMTKEESNLFKKKGINMMRSLGYKFEM